MPHPTCFVIFGAAVRPDGSPSGALRRRVEGALAAAAGVSDRRFIATGGVGLHPPAEADLMRDLLIEGGARDTEIWLERQATDTFSSAVLVTALLRARNTSGPVVACSSDYHTPRCTWLLRLLGTPATRAPMPPSRPTLGTRKWLYYLTREAAALPYDTALALLHRARTRRT